MGISSSNLIKLAAIFFTFPLLIACLGKAQYAGLEPSGLRVGDQVVIEMEGVFSIGYDMTDGTGAGAGSSEDPISFTITNEKPVSEGEDVPLGITSLYLRPKGQDFSDPGFKIYMGVDFCTRDDSGNPIFSSEEASNMIAEYDPVLNIGGSDHHLDKGKPIRIGGKVMGVHVNREDGSTSYFTREQLLEKITYQNPGGISDCKLTKNTLMSHGVSSPIRIKLVKAPPKDLTIGEAGPPQDPSGESTSVGDPLTPGSGAEKPLETSGTCSLSSLAGHNTVNPVLLFYLAAFLLGGIWVRRR